MSTEEYQTVIAEPQRWLSGRQRRWMRPRGIVANALYACIWWINRVLVKLLFRLRVHGLSNLPNTGPFILAPNHASPLDPPVLAASLPLSLLLLTFWAGKETTVLKTRVRKVLSWVTRVIPIRAEASALAAATIILQRNYSLVWFPEGRRSLDGQLQDFRQGVGVLLATCDVPIIPVAISGARKAFSGRDDWPHIGTEIVVRFGCARSAQQLGLTSGTTEEIADAVRTLRENVRTLGEDNRED